MQAIEDYTSYNTGMKKSLKDKLFFTEWLDNIDALVDFGCADGAMLEAVREISPNIGLTGIDMNEIMLQRIKDSGVRTICSDLPKDSGRRYINTALNLSSVLHEVYSYGSPEYIKTFWNTVNEEKYSYIFIRDMMYDDSFVMNFNSEWERKVRMAADPAQVRDFERFHGSMSQHKNLVHFLLKYRYLTNWEREVRENYLSFTVADIVTNLKNYDCVYFNRYALPFLQDKVQEDFGIRFNEMTHVKMVLKLNS